MATARFVAIKPCWVALAGAECRRNDGHEPMFWSIESLEEGQELHLKQPAFGARVYMAMPGGIAKTSIKRGSRLAEMSRKPAVHFTMLDVDNFFTGVPLRVRPFGKDTESLEELARCESLTVRLDSDRVGVRLDGIELDPGPERLSEPSCPGAIQVTNDGGVIIHGPDGPTIGGYRKIGVVHSGDLDLLAQARPLGPISFVIAD